MKASNYEIFKMMAADLARQNLYKTNRMLFDLYALVAVQHLLDSGLSQDEEKSRMNYVFWKLKADEIDQLLEVSRMIYSLKPHPKESVEDYQPKVGDLVEFTLPELEKQWASGLIYYISEPGLCSILQTLSGRTFKVDKSQVRKRKKQRI